MLRVDMIYTKHFYRMHLYLFIFLIIPLSHPHSGESKAEFCTERIVQFYISPSRVTACDDSLWHIRESGHVGQSIIANQPGENVFRVLGRWSL